MVPKCAMSLVLNMGMVKAGGKRRFLAQLCGLAMARDMYIVGYATLRFEVRISLNLKKERKELIVIEVLCLNKEQGKEHHMYKLFKGRVEPSADMEYFLERYPTSTKFNI